MNQLKLITRLWSTIACVTVQWNFHQALFKFQKKTAKQPVTATTTTTTTTTTSFGYI